MITKTEYYAVSLVVDEDGDTVARVLNYPQCVSHGKDAEQAIDNLASMAELFVVDCIESGDAIPEPLLAYARHLKECEEFMDKIINSVTPCFSLRHCATQDCKDKRVINGYYWARAKNNGGELDDWEVVEVRGNDGWQVVEQCGGDLARELHEFVFGEPPVRIERTV